MPFSTRMQTADDVVALFREYSIDDGSATKDATSGTAVDVKLRHHQLKDSGGTKVAPVRHIKHSTGVIRHVELVETKARHEKEQALNAKTKHLVYVDGPSKGGLKPGADINEVFRLGREVDEEFRANSVKGRGTLQSFYFDNAQVGRTVPCYRLPWNPTGTAMELEIPNQGGGGPSDTNPILFLTAALSGCSIYVTGSRKNPRVFHCGTEGKTDGRSTKQFWDQVMDELGVDTGTGGSAHAGEYMKAVRGSSAVSETERKHAKHDIKRAYKDQLKVEKVDSWGAFFGVRATSGDWTFYLQQNTSVTYHKLRVTSVLKRHVKVGEAITVSRPIVLREVFPGGGGAARIDVPNMRALPTV